MPRSTRGCAEASKVLEAGRELLREGLHVAIIGPPNAGKSSLLNVMTRREAAIVSVEPGTTRDVVEVALDVRGYPMVIADTAGLRDTVEEVEKEGVRHSGSSSPRGARLFQRCERAVDRTVVCVVAIYCDIELHHVFLPSQGYSRPSFIKR